MVQEKYFVNMFIDSWLFFLLLFFLVFISIYYYYIIGGNYLFYCCFCQVGVLIIYYWEFMFVGDGFRNDFLFDLVWIIYFLY